MGQRSYRQQCGLARALDILGERWTLLVLRELSTGPKRFKDLHEALAGAGTNLLTVRLRELEGVGVLRRRRLPPPAGVDVYELTARGGQLRGPMEALALWGADLVDPTDSSATSRAIWVAVWLRASASTRRVPDEAVPAEFAVGDETFFFESDAGTLELTAGPAPRPRVRVICDDVRTFREFVRKEQESSDLIASGRVRVEGDQNAFDRFVVDVLPARPS